MLSVQEALLMQAVADEIEREEATQLGGVVGATGGGKAFFPQGHFYLALL